MKGVALDMSAVVQTDNKTNKIVVSYEVELERIINTLTVGQFRNSIKFLFELLNGEFPISSAEELEVIKSFNLLFNSRAENKMVSILNKPINISIDDLLSQSLNDDYAITEKLDGVRYLLYFNDIGVYFIRPDRYVLKIDNFSGLHNTILDGEYVEKNNTFFVFDVLFMNGKDLTHNKFEERIAKMDYFIWSSKTPQRAVNIVKKTFIHTNDFYKDIDSGFDLVKARDEAGLSTDGIIIQPIKMPYNNFILRQTNATQSRNEIWMPTLKWKPSTHMSIDFLVKLAQERDVYYLYAADNNNIVKFVGTPRHPYSKNIVIGGGMFQGENINGKIVEFKWDYNDSNFIPMRYRHDKLNANNINIILGTFGVKSGIWNDIMEPITEADIRGDTLKVMRRLHNNIKSNMLINIKENSTILDIGSGRGGDISKWKRRHLNVFGVEPNADNITELYKRLPPAFSDKFVFAQIGAEETEKVIEFTKHTLLDGVISFFSLTFFLETEKMFEGLLSTIDKIVKPSGKFVGIVMDGEKVKKLLEHGDTYINRSFSIVSKGSPSVIEKKSEFGEETGDFGNKILINLNDPTSMVKNQEEYLVNFKYLEKRLGEMGFRLTYSKILGNDVMTEINKALLIIETITDGHTVENVKDKFQTRNNIYETIVQLISKSKSKEFKKVISEYIEKEIQRSQEKGDSTDDLVIVKNIIEKLNPTITKAKAMAIFRNDDNDLFNKILKYLDEYEPIQEIEEGLINKGEGTRIKQELKELIYKSFETNVNMLPKPSQVFSSLNRSFVFVRDGIETAILKKEEEKFPIKTNTIIVSLLGERYKFVRIKTIDSKFSILHALSLRDKNYVDANEEEKVKFVNKMIQYILNYTDFDLYKKLSRGLLHKYLSYNFIEKSKNEEEAINKAWEKYKLDLATEWNEVNMIELISNVVDRDIYIVSSKNMLPYKPTTKCEDLYKSRKSVILLKNLEGHYDLLGRVEGNKLIKALDFNDGIITSMRNLICAKQDVIIQPIVPQVPQVPLVPLVPQIETKKHKFKSIVISKSREIKDVIDYDMFSIIPGETEYSSIMPYQVQQLYNVLDVLEKQLGKKINSFIDGTANVGVEFLHIAKKYPNATGVAVELDYETFNLLLLNIKNIAPSKNLTAVNDNIVNYIKVFTPNVDFISLDPPWGGKDYIKKTNLKLYLDEKPIGTVIKLIFSITTIPIVLLRVPRNFDFNSLNTIKYSKHNINSMTGKLSYYLLIIEKSSV